MTRREIIRTLYIGGQAAIGAELVAVFGVFLFLIFYRELVLEVQNISTSYEILIAFIETYQTNPLPFLMSTVLMLSIPTLAMLTVVWSWHLYFAYEGVQLMNWVATTMAIIGATLMFANMGVSIWSFSLAAQALRNGVITESDIYLVFAVAEGLQVGAMFTLYAIYPVLLSFASWQKRLLPKWFLVMAIALTVVSDLNLVFGTRVEALAQLVQGVMILWPFLMGVVLLQKAQTLSAQSEHDHQTRTPSSVYMTPPTK